jgi:hypothetical protein
MEPSPHFEEVIEPLLGWVAGIWPSLATELRTAIQQIDRREAGWMAASRALGYEARREGTAADVALWFWTAAAWLEQHKEGRSDG